MPAPIDLDERRAPSASDERRPLWHRRRRRALYSGNTSFLTISGAQLVFPEQRGRYNFQRRTRRT
jgi:hypothetical protein